MDGGGRVNKKNVRLGIVGCGTIAHFHVRAISQLENASAVMCFGPSQVSAERFAEQYGLCVSKDLDEMLRSDAVDAVCICTPSGLHTPQAIQALQAGKHVIVEKPMSLTLEEADRLIAASEETDKKVCVISQFRFQPAIQEVKRALDEKAFGRVVSARLSMPYYRSDAYYKSGSWRGTWKMDGGGALMNQGIHGIDVFRYLMGPIRSVQGIARTLVHPIEVEDTAVAMLEFCNGALGILMGTTTCNPGYPRTIEIYGTQGSVVLEEDSIKRWDLSIPCSLPIGNDAQSVASSDPKAISIEGHIRQIGDFVRAVLCGTPVLLDARAGRLPLEIILAVYESSKTGKPVFLEANLLRYTH